MSNVLHLNPEQLTAMRLAMYGRIDQLEGNAALCFTCAYVHSEEVRMRGRSRADQMESAADYLEQMRHCVRILAKSYSRPRARRPRVRQGAPA